MTNSRASSKMVLLDQHLASGTEATYTYTPSIALDMATKYKEIIVYISGSATAALQLLMKINASTNYDWVQSFGDTTTLQTAIGVDATTMVVCPSALIDGAVSFHAKIIILLNRASGLLYTNSRGSATHEGQTWDSNEVQDAATTITSIEIKTSTSTWIANTEITTYGVRR